MGTRVERSTLTAEQHLMLELIADHPLIVGTLVAHRILRMNPVIVCGALAGAMTVDAAVTDCCEVAESQTPVLGVVVPYAIANVFLIVLGLIFVSLTVGCPSRKPISLRRRTTVTQPRARFFACLYRVDPGMGILISVALPDGR